MNESTFQVAQAADLHGKQVWQLGNPVPTRPGTKIEKMIIVGNTVEVYARIDADATKGHRETLYAPVVGIVMSIAPAQEWNKAVAAIPDYIPRLSEVHDITGNVWRVNAEMAGLPNTRIAMIIESGDTVEIFIIPDANGEFGQAGVFLHATLLPLTVLRTVAGELSLTEWSRLQTDESIQLRLGVDPDDNDDDDDDEAPPQYAQQAYPQQMPQMPPQGGHFVDGPQGPPPMMQHMPPPPMAMPSLAGMHQPPPPAMPSPPPAQVQPPPQEMNGVVPPQATQSQTQTE